MTTTTSPFPAPTFHALCYVPRQRQAAISASPVQRILAAAHTSAPHSDTNHWCFYLQTTASSSVQLDCQPSHSVPSTVLAAGSKACVVLSEWAAHVTPPDVEAVFELDVVPGLRVADVVRVLAEHGRLQYEFDARGVGCRCWTTDQIELWRTEGLVVDAGQAQAAVAGILMLWPERTPLALDRGAYYG
ncbi:MAG: hypothetical protein M1826_007361 [Phylliscum demangeonii]|nr:MAG: hypothetical protein M1826_007361 [Phylliscum demangeonii]